MELKIDKGIPVHAPTTLIGQLASMEVGDSVLVSSDRIASVRSLTYRLHGRTFKTRRWDDKGSYRVWRVA